MKRTVKKSKYSYSNIISLLSIIILVGLAFYLYKQKSAPKTRKIIPNPTGFAKQKAKSPSRLIGSRDTIYDTPEKILDLFQQLGVEYSVPMRFAEDAKVFEKMKKTDFDLYNKNPSKYELTSAQYEEAVKNKEVAPVYIKWVDDLMGYGVYAKEDIPADYLIAEYGGMVTHKNKIKNKTWSWSHPTSGSFSDKFPKDMSLNGYNFGNETRFINHGDDPEKNLPNCKTVFTYVNGTWRLLYVAKRSIKKDEEILVSYGKTYWRKRELLEN